METHRLINLWCAVFLLTLGFTACSDDDNSSSGTGIVSTWKYIQGTDGEYYELLRFNSDGTFLLETSFSALIQMGLSFWKNMNFIIVLTNGVLERIVARMNTMKDIENCSCVMWMKTVI